MVVVGDRVVCNYSGRVTQKGVAIPGVKGAAFCNLPCLLAWLYDTVPPGELLENAIDSVCQYYEQTRDNIARAPDRKRLITFGGDETYEQWIGSLSNWEALTDAKGSTAEELQKGLSKRGKRDSNSVKGAKGSKQSQSFTAGAWVITHNKAAAGCVKANALDVLEAEDAGAPESTGKRLTPMQAARKPRAYAKAHEEMRLTHTEQPGFAADYCTLHNMAAEPDDKQYNTIASNLLGVKVFGPASVIFFKKTTVKF